MTFFTICPKKVKQNTLSLFLSHTNTHTQDTQKSTPGFSHAHLQLGNKLLFPWPRQHDVESAKGTQNTRTGTERKDSGTPWWGQPGVSWSSVDTWPETRFLALHCVKSLLLLRLLIAVLNRQGDFCTVCAASLSKQFMCSSQKGWGGEDKKCRWLANLCKPTKFNFSGFVCKPQNLQPKQQGKLCRTSLANWLQFIEHCSNTVLSTGRRCPAARSSVGMETSRAGLGSQWELCQLVNWPPANNNGQSVNWCQSSTPPSRFLKTWRELTSIGQIRQQLWVSSKIAVNCKHTWVWASIPWFPGLHRGIAANQELTPRTLFLTPPPLKPDFGFLIPSGDLPTHLPTGCPRWNLWSAPVTYHGLVVTISEGKTRRGGWSAGAAGSPGSIALLPCDHRLRWSPAELWIHMLIVYSRVCAAFICQNIITFLSDSGVSHGRVSAKFTIPVDSLTPTKTSLNAFLVDAKNMTAVRSWPHLQILSGVFQTWTRQRTAPKKKGKKTPTGTQLLVAGVSLVNIRDREELHLKSPQRQNCEMNSGSFWATGETGPNDIKHCHRAVKWNCRISIPCIPRVSQNLTDYTYSNPKWQWCSDQWNVNSTVIWKARFKMLEL